MLICYLLRVVDLFEDDLFVFGFEGPCGGGCVLLDFLGEFFGVFALAEDVFERRVPGWDVEIFLVGLIGEPEQRLLL